MKVVDYLRGPIRHMKRIGEDPEFQALSARTHDRLVKMKAQGRLTEAKETNEPATSGNSASSEPSELGGITYYDTGRSGSSYYDAFCRANRSDPVNLVNDRPGSGQQRSENPSVWASWSRENSPVRNITPPDCFHKLREWAIVIERPKPDEDFYWFGTGRSERDSTG